MLDNIIFMLYNMLCYICYITCNVRLRYIAYYVSFLLRYITCYFMLRYITCYDVLCLSSVIEHVVFMSCYITCYIYVI